MASSALLGELCHEVWCIFGFVFFLFFLSELCKNFCQAKYVSAPSPTEVAGKSPIDFSGSRAGHQLDPTSYLKMLFPWGE